MKNVAELGVVAITRDVVLFASLVLALAHFVDGVDVFGNDELPLAKMFAEYFVRLPAKETLRRWRPAQYFEFVVPLDHGQRRVFDVKRESFVFVESRSFGQFALGDVTNDGDAADHFAVFVVTW